MDPIGAVANSSIIVLRTNPNPTLGMARNYASRGWAVTPVKFRAKQPLLRNWQHGEIAEDDLDHYFGSGEVNIGVVLGEASHGLVDVDIDDPVALPFAEKFLPTTGCKFGRASMPRSHWVYEVASPGRREAFTICDEILVELRWESVSDGLSGFGASLGRVD